MNRRTGLLAMIAIAMIAAVAKADCKAAGGKVLIVLSSKNTLTLKDGASHPTGFYMNELGVPLPEHISFCIEAMRDVAEALGGACDRYACGAVGEGVVGGVRDVAAVAAGVGRGNSQPLNNAIIRNQ